MSANLTDLTIDLDALTFQDLIDIQRVTGTKVTRETLADPGIDVVAAMLWVTLRKESPELTFAAFCQQGIGVELAGRAVPVANRSGEPTGVGRGPKGEAGPVTTGRKPSRGH